MKAATLARMTGMGLVLVSLCASQVDERCSGTAVEKGPTLLSSYEPLKSAARAGTDEKKLTFRLTITETGSVRNVAITYPATLLSSDKVKGEILKLRFCPAVKFSRYAEVKGEFQIQLK